MSAPISAGHSQLGLRVAADGATGGVGLVSFSGGSQLDRS